MEPIITYNVIPKLPSELEPLREMVYNLWWTWEPSARRLFRFLDIPLWDATNHNPLRMLQTCRQARLTEVADDEHFLKDMHSVYSRFQAYMARKDTYGKLRCETTPLQHPVAYFSAEYGFHESFPNYSGGLGILSGDHCKSASDLDLNFVAVGLLYRKPWGQENLTLGFSVARTAAWSQSTDAQILVPGALRSYTTLSADSEFNRTTISIAAAWSSGSWRLGGGLLGDILNLRDVQAASYRQETGGAVQTSVGSYRATGGQGMLRLGLGAQADLSEEWKFGAILRTPGIRIVPSGVYAVDVVAQTGSRSQQSTFFDAEADFQYKLPFEASIGIAWVRPTFEVEIDVKGQTATSTYDGFSSTQPVVSINDPGTGGQAVVTTSPFPGRKFQGRAIVNLSIGGWLRLDEKGIWKLHAGFSTDQSPVGSEDQFFSRVNLSNATLGLGGAVGKIAGSLGLTYQFGTTDDVTVVDAGGGTLARTKFKISNFGILYSLTYAF